jgi:EAL domain-containing protein (putative c-di-GMP-specific phosphodiesterase class I)
MDVAYISEFVGDQSVFREVDAPGFEDIIKPGDSRSLDDVYCRHILAGRLPELMPDTSNVPFAASMPITKAASIGAHMSVPIHLSSGENYGMFCCLSFNPDNSLNQRDLQMMKVFAELAAKEIDEKLSVARAAEGIKAKLRNAAAADEISIVYQPICSIASGKVMGLECLSRFSGKPICSPDVWFAEAAEAQLGGWLECLSIRRAVPAMHVLPSEVYLAVNASPEAVLSEEFLSALSGAALDRLVLELTEHASVQDYPKLIEKLAPLRSAGMRLAVDDAGSGYSGLQHILRIRPDIIKLDIELIRGIDQDSTKQALSTALAAFARQTNSKIIAEGVETTAELETLKGLGIELAQGYLLARPMSLDKTVEFLNANAATNRLVA